jgi:hypothetical protein
VDGGGRVSLRRSKSVVVGNPSCFERGRGLQWGDPRGVVAAEQSCSRGVQDGFRGVQEVFDRLWWSTGGCCVREVVFTRQTRGRGCERDVVMLFERLWAQMRGRGCEREVVVVFEGWWAQTRGRGGVREVVGANRWWWTWRHRCQHADVVGRWWWWLTRRRRCQRVNVVEGRVVVVVVVDIIVDVVASTKRSQREG